MSLPSTYTETNYTRYERFAAEAIWRSVADSGGQHRVLPDGRCDIILRFGLVRNRPKGAITPMIAGAATQFRIVPIEAGTGYIGVRLRPAAAHAMLGINLRKLVNHGIVGDEVLGILPDISRLCEPAVTIDEIAERLSSFVEERSANIKLDVLTSNLIDTIHITGGRMSISEIAELHGIDVRTVHRRIMAATGLSPKEMAMVIQFHRALRLRCKEGLSVASTAFEAGYADQAHMTRVFRQMGGVSPARLPSLVLVGLPI